jgi:hypothetical protein
MIQKTFTTKKQEIISLVDNYKNALEVAEKYLDISDLEEATKDRIFDFYNNALQNIEAETTKGFVNYLVRELSEFWSYHFAIWVELFWKEIAEKNIQLTRTDNVHKIIERKRFLGVGEAVMFNNNWSGMVSSIYLYRYTRDQLCCMEELIRKDKEKRLDLLIKSLRNRRVNDSEYMKCTEAISYFTNGKMFNENISKEEISLLFSKEELNVLKNIWRLD